MSSIREAKKELKIIRAKILEMNPTQLVNFYKPFTPEKLISIQKSVAKALDGKKREIIEAKCKQIERLRKEVEQLEAKYQ